MLTQTLFLSRHTNTLKSEHLVFLDCLIHSSLILLASTCSFKTLNISFSWLSALDLYTICQSAVPSSSIIADHPWWKISFIKMSTLAWSLWCVSQVHHVHTEAQTTNTTCLNPALWNLSCCDWLLYINCILDFDRPSHGDHKLTPNVLWTFSNNCLVWWFAGLTIHMHQTICCWTIHH